MALIAGALTPLGFAPFSLSFLPFFTLAALFLTWLHATSARNAAWLGFLFGLGLFGAGVSWIYVSLHTFGNMAAPLAALAVLGFVALLALFPALAGWIQQQFASAPVWQRLLLAMPAAWILAEWLRGWVLTGFPWLALGYAQTEAPLGAWAPVLGVYGVGWLAALVAGSLAELLAFALHSDRAASAGRRLRGWRGLLAATLAVLAIYAGSLLLRGKQWTTPSGQPLSATLVQGNIPIPEKWRPPSRQKILDTHLQLSAGGSDLVIWPEGAAPDFLQRLGEPFWSRLREISAAGSSVIFGGVESTPDQHYYNSAIFLPAGSYADTGQQLAAAALYRKSHLVPFGDYFPLPDFLLGVLDYLHIPMSDFSAWQQPQALFDIHGHPAAVTICYEDAFGEELLPRLPQAQMLINLSEDGWFGHSIGPLQRLQMAQMRALETGRPVLRAANTGVTAFIDHHGRLLSRLPQYERGALQGEVQPMRGATPYVRWGNWPLLAALFAVLLVLLLLRRKTWPDVEKHGFSTSG